MAKVHRVVTTAKGEAGARELVQWARDALAGEKPTLLVCFASMQQPLAQVMPVLAEAFPGVALLGSSTAGEFTELGERQLAAVLVAIVGDFVAHAVFAEGLKADVEGAVARAVGALPSRAEGYPHRTAILLFDGLVGVGEEVTLHCAASLGIEVPIAGAAAGDDWAIQGTWVGAGARAAVDSLALAVLDTRVPLGIGVAHGHRTVGQRARVTRSEGSVVSELDGKPAWQRYAELTRPFSVPTWGVDPDAITDPGKRLQFFAWYQTGVDLGGAGYKNRTPLARLESDALAFACGIPEGTELEVLSSDPRAQIESAREAALSAAGKLQGPAAGALVFECGCRKVYLGEDFDKAPAVVAEALGGVPLGGLEAYGEVALNVGDFSGFHNATTVVLAFPREGL